ncbi:hypothetical protein DRH13_05885, partial [Candidatus Woesebacteria bacterium]
MEKKLKAQCKAKTFDGWNRFPCERNATKEGYCWQHHPDNIEKRQKKSDEKWEAKRKRSPAYQLIEAREKIKELEEEIER